MTQATDIRTFKSRSRQVSRNVREAARTQHVGPIALARKADISLRQALLTYAGREANIGDLLAMREVLGLNLSDMFSGTDRQGN